MKALLTRVLEGRNLSSDEMRDAVGQVMDGGADAVQVAGLLVALRCKGETVDEITGAAAAMRARMTPVPIAHAVVDTCGTGGDGADTFNISTAAALVAAAGGAKVAKHGNRSVSSRSGSADLLEALGVKLDCGPDVVAQCIDQLGIGFMFAPGHHPAMKHVVAVRRALGARTIFNVLGPLTNPAGAKFQVLGVFSEHLVEPLAHVARTLGCERVWVVHGRDGLDEITLCDSTLIAEATSSGVTTSVFDPESVGLAQVDPAALVGGDPQENAELCRSILAGKGPKALTDIVCLNAGAALVVSGVCEDLRAGVGRAQEVVTAGTPFETLQGLIQRTQ